MDIYNTSKFEEVTFVAHFPKTRVAVSALKSECSEREVYDTKWQLKILKHLKIE